MYFIDALWKAVRLVGSQAELARRLGVEPNIISYWLNGAAKKIPLKYAYAIEKITDKKVSRYELSHEFLEIEDIDPLNNTTQLLSISERVESAIALEKTLTNQKGKKANLPELKGKQTRDIVAHRFGFKARTYQYAKKVILKGCPELIQAMDERCIAISTAAEIADLPKSEQLHYLTKYRIAKTKSTLFTQANQLPNKYLKSAFEFLVFERIETLVTINTETILKRMEELNMGRIRSVKPELFEHEELYDAEDHYQLPLRVAFMGLFTAADKEGRFKWRPRSLKLKILPYDDVDFSAVLHALAERGFILRYEANGEVYGCIPTWKVHQVPNCREKESQLPPPPLCLAETKQDKPSESFQTDTQAVNAIVTREARVEYASTASSDLSRGELEGKGKELEGELERKGRDRDARVTQVFDVWKSTFNHPNAMLDDKRKKIIQQALRGYTVEQLCEAIQGCSLTPHNMGDNEQGQRYDGLHVIFRNADQIDRFIHNYHHPPRVKSRSEKRAEKNIHHIQNWLDIKLGESNNDSS